MHFTVIFWYYCSLSVMAPFNPHQLSFFKKKIHQWCALSGSNPHILLPSKEKRLSFVWMLLLPPVHHQVLHLCSAQSALINLPWCLPHFTASSPLSKFFILFAHSHPPPGSLYTLPLGVRCSSFISLSPPEDCSS